MENYVVSGNYVQGLTNALNIDSNPQDWKPFIDLLKLDREFLFLPTEIN